MVTQYKISFILIPELLPQNGNTAQSRQNRLHKLQRRLLQNTTTPQLTVFQISRWGHMSQYRNQEPSYGILMGW